MSSYDTLYKNLPYYFRPIIEFQEILKAHGYAIDEFERVMYQIAANNYIPTCDITTLKFWENLLEINVLPEDTVPVRRQRVLQRMALAVPYSMGYLTDLLTQMFGEDGYEYHVDPVACMIYIIIRSYNYCDLAFLYSMIWDIIPAHLGIDAKQEVINNVESTLYVGGFTQSIIEQTISYENTYYVPLDITFGGFVSGTQIKTV